MGKIKKKRTKKYNAVKHLNNEVLNVFKTHQLKACCMNHLEASIILEGRENKLMLKVPTEISTQIKQNKFKWHHIMFALIRDQRGNMEITIGETDLVHCDANGTPILRDGKPVPINHAVYLDGIAEQLNKAHVGFIKSLNRLNVVNSGWIAAPYEFEFSDEMIDDIADRLDAWNYMTRYEHEQKQIKTGIYSDNNA